MDAHAPESSSRSWAVVAFPLGPGYRGRYATLTYTKGLDMKKLIGSILICLLWSANVQSQDDMTPPKTVPQWVVVVASEQGLVSMTFPNKDDADTETYTVTVPYQEKGPDGNLQMKFRTETRVRKKKPDVPDRPRIVRWRAKDLKFLDLSGKQLEFATISERLSKPTPVMALTGPTIDKFFAQILKPETLVVVIPSRGVRR